MASSIRLISLAVLVLLFVAYSTSAQTLSCRTDTIPMQTEEVILESCGQLRELVCEATYPVAYNGRWNYEWQLKAGARLVAEETQTFSCNTTPCAIPWISFSTIAAVGDLQVSLRVFKRVPLIGSYNTFEGSSNAVHISVPDVTGDSLFDPLPASLGDGAGVHAHPALVGDFNGDGRSDVVFVGQGWNGAGLNIRTKLSNGDGTWNARWQALGDGAGVHDHPALVGDFNGDGRSDIAFVGQGWNGAGLNIRTKLSNGDGTWNARRQVLGDGAGVHDHPTLVGDVDRDGRDDLVFSGFDWTCPGLNLRVKHSNGNGQWRPASQIVQGPRDVLDRRVFLAPFTPGGEDLLFLRQPPTGLELLLLAGQ